MPYHYYAGRASFISFSRGEWGYRRRKEGTGFLLTPRVLGEGKRLGKGSLRFTPKEKRKKIVRSGKKEEKKKTLLFLPPMRARRR